jgi:predicted alpha/beta hydrolase family esterase
MPSTLAHLVLPGYGNSGPAHWQTLWEAEEASFRRVDLGDWDSPARDAWVARLEKAVAAETGDLVIVAHSLACLLVAHWAASAPAASLDRVRSAFLVAPPDPAGPAFPPSAAGFAPVPRETLPFRSLVVASSDDPYGSLEWQGGLASAWGSGFSAVGAKGHINAASGLGDWPEGWRLLQRLAVE